MATLAMHIDGFACISFVWDWLSHLLLTFSVVLRGFVLGLVLFLLRTSDWKFCQHMYQWCINIWFLTIL